MKNKQKMVWLNKISFFMDLGLNNLIYGLNINGFNQGKFLADKKNEEICISFNNQL